MSDNGTEFTTPVGRIVWGHPLKPQDKTDDNNVKILDANGQPIKQWSFGVAIPKADFQQQVWPYLAAETAKGYPQGTPPKYSYKYKDGDSTDPVWSQGKQGKPYAEREGHPGCFILTFSTEFQPPAVFKFENGAYQQLQPDQIKTGDFVMVGTNAKWHAGQSPGLYVNPMTVLLAFEGDAISGNFAADPTQMFGTAPQVGQMPQGARPVGAAAPMQQAPAGTMPGMGMPGQMPGAPMQPQQQYAPQPVQQPQMPPMGQPPMQQPQQFAPPAPQQMPPPAHDFVQNAGMPQQYAPQPQGMPGTAPFPGAMPPR